MDQLRRSPFLRLCPFLSVIFLHGRRTMLFQENQRSKQQGITHGSDERWKTGENTTTAKNINLSSFRSIEDHTSDKDKSHSSRSVEESTETVEGVSACLLLRDENHQLAEWLAYHYLVLPLRHLVVAIDPTSLTSPNEILNRWMETTSDDFHPITLALWGDKDYYDGKEVGGHPLYLDRQNRFIRSCAQYHKEMNRTWVIMTDPDEFITLNLFKENDPTFTDAKVEEWELLDMKTSRPGIYQKFFDHGINYTQRGLRQHRPDLWRERKQKIRARESQHISLPGRGTTLMDIMNQSPWVGDTCTRIPRVLYSQTESQKDEVLKSNAGEYGFDPMKFRTLRFFHHDRKSPGWRGKVVVDISRTPTSELAIIPESVHSPFPSCGWVIPRYEESILRIHHYLGTWEEYSYKRDCRKTREKFTSWSSTSVETNYDLQHWVGDFMDQVGIARGKYLLQGAGDIPSVNVSTAGCIEAA